MNKEATFTSRFSDLDTEPLSVDLYTEDRYFEAQKEKIFKKCWLFAGLANQIPNPGDYFLKKLPTLDMSVLFVRGKDGVVRGFDNICPHRGTNLCNESAGHLPRFTCPFHAWTFDTQGKLIGVPAGQTFFDMNKADYGLRAIKTDLCGDFIFFTLDDHQPESLEAFLGELAPVLCGLPAQQWTAHYNTHTRIKANWIITLDGTRESYHVFSLHKKTGAAANSDATHMGTLTNARDLGYHARSGYWGNQAYSPSVLECAAAEAAPRSRGTTSGNVGRPTDVCPVVNENNHPEWSIDVYSIFPNTVISTNGFQMNLQQSWPTSPRDTIGELYGYFPGATTAAERFALELGLVQARDVTNEDINNYERMQANYDGGRIDRILFGDLEVLCRHHYSAMHRWLDAH